MKNTADNITHLDLYEFMQNEWEYSDDEAPKFLKPINGMDGAYVDDHGNIYANIVTLGSIEQMSSSELAEHFFSEAIWSLKNEPDNKYTIMLMIHNWMENAIKEILRKHCR